MQIFHYTLLIKRFGTVSISLEIFFCQVHIVFENVITLQQRFK